MILVYIILRDQLLAAPRDYDPAADEQVQAKLAGEQLANFLSLFPFPPELSESQNITR